MERPDPDARLPEEVILEVENQNFLDARIHANWNGVRQRLGLVNGNTTQTFRLRGRDGILRVEVDFVAGGGFISDPLSVWRGDTVRLVIPPGA